MDSNKPQYCKIASFGRKQCYIFLFKHIKTQAHTRPLTTKWEPKNKEVKKPFNHLLCVMPCDLGLQLALRVECVLPLKVTKSALNDNSCTHKCTKLYHDISRIDW